MDAKPVTRNSCRLCMPLGASLVFKGIANSMALLHGGQGCATYIRRYMIGHFREPIDIASSSFSEETAVFGGKDNLFTSLDTIISRYKPELIGIATTCVSETIGEDLGMYLHEYAVRNAGEELPALIKVSTPSYECNHLGGYWRAVSSCIAELCEKKAFNGSLSIFPGIISPADIREIKGWMQRLQIPLTIFPDYSETLDGGPWEDYQSIPPGGTNLQEIRSIPDSSLCVEFGIGERKGMSPVEYIEQKFRIPVLRIPLPVGIELTDHFFAVLAKFFAVEPDLEIQKERQRCADLYIDGHKIAFGKRCVVYGDEDMVSSLVSFLCEAGFAPALVAANTCGGSIRDAVYKICDSKQLEDCRFMDNVDFSEIEQAVNEIHAREPLDFMLGNSKGHKIARAAKIPLIRVGFPIHDRIGAAGICITGYRGAAQLYSTIVNRILEEQQESGEYQYGNY